MELTYHERIWVNSQVIDIRLPKGIVSPVMTQPPRDRKHDICTCVRLATKRCVDSVEVAVVAYDGFILAVIVVLVVGAVAGEGGHYKYK